MICPVTTPIPDERRSPSVPVARTTFLITYRGLRGRTHALHFADDAGALVLAPFERLALLSAWRLPQGTWTLEGAMQWAEFMAPGWAA